jgi:transmembrane 9 superfamily protein 2/4
LGEIFAGSRTESTNYDLRMAEDVNCKVLCKVSMKKEQVLKMKQLIDDQYVVNLMVDNLPGAMELSGEEGEAVQYGLGYWVGGIILDLSPEVNSASEVVAAAALDSSSLMKKAKESKNAPRYLNNHILLKLFYHVPISLQSYTGAYSAGASADEIMTGASASESKKNADGSNLKRIVRFEVHPYSVKHVITEKNTIATRRFLGSEKSIEKDSFDPSTVSTCTDKGEIPKSNLVLDFGDDGMEVVYSYAVEWINSPTSWATRWDIYLSMGGQTHDDVHWLSITNSILVAIFLTALVALILVRTLRKGKSKRKNIFEFCFWNFHLTLCLNIMFIHYVQI